MNEWIAIACICLWGTALTVFVMKSSCQSAVTLADKGGPSGPVIIKNFIKDKFGNIVKRDKRIPRRGDDISAFEAEQKEKEK